MTSAPATLAADAQAAQPTAGRRYALGVLLAVATVAFIDRTILNTVGQAIKVDLGLSDLQLGLLGGAAFAIFYGVLGLPIARLAERRSRVAIISLSVAVWSVMTALCGAAGSFTHLLLARVGVGVGEAGAGPASQSLLSDLFPPEQRASAFGVLGLATPLGIILGGIGGAVVAEQFGWRAAFLLVGLPGLAVALLVQLTLKEPLRGAAEGRTVAADAPPLSTVIRTLARSPAFRHLLAAAIVVNFVGFSGMTFAHPYFVRTFDVGYAEAAVAFAIINSISLSGGYLIGGFVTDRLARRDVRWYGWLPGVAMFLAAGAYVLGFSQSSWLWTIVLLVPPGLFAGVYFAPTFAVTHNLVEPRMRASATALLTLTMSVLGMTVGPILTGWLSDLFAARSFAGDYAAACQGQAAAAELCRAASSQGLRQALIAVVSLYALAGVHFLLAARSLRRELAQPGDVVR